MAIMARPTRKSLPEPELLPPLHFHPPSNGEYCPFPAPERARRAEALWRRTVEQRHARLGLSRRDFAQSACGAAAALWALNQVGCSDPDRRPYRVDEGMLDDEAAAAQVLGGDDFIFDVQTHVAEPLGAFDIKNPPDLAVDFIRQIYVQSDTTVACVTATPTERELGSSKVESNAELREIVDRIAGPRLIMHGNIKPENGPAELEYMSELAARFPIAAWKIFPQPGDLRMDSEEVGGACIERARSLGIRLFAAHRGLSGGGGIDVPGSPRDVVRAARAAPDMRFLIYHSGWEERGDENHPFDPDDPNPTGVDRLIRSLLDSGLGPTDNVYAELGTTWNGLIGNPESAAHVFGKLLAYLGPDRILWGTDSVFGGTPQLQIVPFRAFTIPEEMQSRYGYPPLTDEVRRKIFGLNAARLYGVDPQATRYAVAEDDLSRLRMAYLDDPRSVPTPARGEYEGPRTRREFLTFLKREGQRKRA
jgi:predicted TIM-barrel fold metal-dependent hydrolase